MPGNVFLVLAGFCLGITSYSLVPFATQIIGISAFAFSLSFFGWFLCKRRTYLICGIFLLSFVIGALRVALVSQTMPEPFLPLLGQKFDLEGLVVADPDIRETTQRVTVEIEREGKKTKVLAVAPTYPEVEYGERVRVQGMLVEPEPFETNAGRTFKYDRFLLKDGIYAIVEKASLETVTPRQGIPSTVMGLLLDGKHAFLEAIARALPEPSASLASGLVAGGKQGLGKELLNAFIVSGLVHIVVLSGYNVMIIAEFVLKSLSSLSRRVAASVAGIMIGGFVLAAGAGSASIRAGLMAGLALTARATGRTYDVIRALFVVGALMLLMNPLLLVYDPGFQLSFLATLGLILGSPRIERMLTFVRNEFFRDLIAATLAAQIAVLPLLLYQTGLFSVVSLPTNIIVLPFVPLAMALSAFAGCVGLVAPVLAPIAGLPAYGVLSSIIAIAEWMASLPLASVSIPEFPFVIVPVAYAGMVLLIYKTKKA
ncbi:MAG: competence protein ComEC [Parcubacteria bacterium C7867-004]|nr:MAG: competence protein ComEC [Parcubacteria bacterium C7867-004]